MVLGAYEKHVAGPRREAIARAERAEKKLAEQRAWNKRRRQAGFPLSAPVQVADCQLLNRMPAAGGSTAPPQAASAESPMNESGRDASQETPRPSSGYSYGRTYLAGSEVSPPPLARLD